MITDKTIQFLRQALWMTDSFDEFMALIDNDWQHVFPLNEESSHVLSGVECDCDPEIDIKHMVVIHQMTSKKGKAND